MDAGRSQRPEPTEHWFSSLVEHSGDLIIVVDKVGTVVYANPIAFRTFGISSEEAIGTSGLRFIDPDDVERVASNLLALTQTPGSTIVDAVRFISVTGEVRDLEVTATNQLDDTEVAGIIINGKDVTDRNDQVRQLEASFDGSIHALAEIVELRDPYTAGHQREVATFACWIAEELDLPSDTIRGIEVAATLHDIGKVSIPSEILTRPGQLNPPEFELIKMHSQAGSDIVARIPFPWPVADMILQHHERLDGSGYPLGLKGDAILLESRIIAVADAISAMSGHRPYRPALGISAALEQLESGRGALYEPAVVDAALAIFRKASTPARISSTHDHEPAPLQDTFRQGRSSARQVGR